MTVFVTHDIGEAVSLSDRTLIQVGSAAHLGLELTVELPRSRAQATTKEDARYLELRRRAFEAIRLRQLKVAR